MVLTKGGDSNAEGSGGPGHIRQLDTGELSLVVFLSENPPPSKAIMFPKGRAGELFSDEDYYSLEARDFSGRSWTASRVRPRFSQLRDGEDRFVTAEATLKELRGQSPLATRPNGSSLEIWYRGSLAFPYNTAVERIERTDEEDLHHSFAIEGAKFTAHGCDYFVRQEGGYLHLSVSSAEEHLPHNFEYRVNEALEFLLARQLSWSVVTKREGGLLSWRMTGAPTNDSSGRMQPPVAFTPGLREECEAALNLLDCFLSRIGAHQDDQRPSLSVAVKTALESSESPIDAHALDLAVAVESVLAKEFAEAGKLDEQFTAELNEAREAIRSLDISEKARNRFIGRISSMGGVSAKGRLLALAAEGVISAEEIGAWERIRNKATHGVFLKSVNQDYIDDFGRLVTLFYRLIFEAVGYTGPYCNYGEIGWPWQRRSDGQD